MQNYKDKCKVESESSHSKVVDLIYDAEIKNHKHYFQVCVGVLLSDIHSLLELLQNEAYVQNKSSGHFIHDLNTIQNEIKHILESPEKQKKFESLLTDYTGAKAPFASVLRSRDMAQLNSAVLKKKLTDSKIKSLHDQKLVALKGLAIINARFFVKRDRYEGKQAEAEFKKAYFEENPTKGVGGKERLVLEEKYVEHHFGDYHHKNLKGLLHELAIDKLYFPYAPHTPGSIASLFTDSKDNFKKFIHAYRKFACIVDKVQLPPTEPEGVGKVADIDTVIGNNDRSNAGSVGSFSGGRRRRTRRAARRSTRRAHGVKRKATRKH